MLLKPLLTADQIAQRISELGAQITADYQGQELILLGVLKGCHPYLSDLARSIDLPMQIDYVQVASYHGQQVGSGAVRFKRDHEIPIEGKHVLLVEDIVDTGLTLGYLRELLETRQPASLAVSALLNKVEARTHDVPVEYIGFDIPNRFVVGYGLDDEERYRNLPYVAVLGD